MKIDIILPVYKAKDFISEAIESVLAQTYTNWHLTLVDDASPDDTVERVRPFCTRYPDRISLIRLQENHQCAGARMVAIHQRGGDALAMLDQDDRWHPKKLQKQVERLKAAPTVHAVHTDMIYIDKMGDTIDGAADKENARRGVIDFDNLSKEELSRALFATPSIRLISSMVSRAAFDDVGGFNTTFFGGEDWEFWVRFSHKYRIAHLAEPLLERRIHSANTSFLFREPRGEEHLQVLDFMEQSYPHVASLAKKRRHQLLRRIIRIELQENNPSKARRYAWDFLKLKPWDLRALMYLGISCAGPVGSKALNMYRSLTAERWRAIQHQPEP